jgi:hypothetical protein
MVLGSDVISDVFHQSVVAWDTRAEHPHWCGLNLYVSMVWWKPETKQNSEAFARTAISQPRTILQGLRFEATFVIKCAFIKLLE